MVLGIFLAIFHKRYWRFLRRASDRLFGKALAVFPVIMRAGLARFFGEAVAEHLIVPRASLHLLIVGPAIVVMGCFTTASGIFGW